MSFGEIVTWPFAKLMVWFYNLTGNYGLALIFFALAVNLIMTPFMAKSKKSMMRSSRLQPKIQELQKRHEGNQQKLNAEMHRSSTPRCRSCTRKRASTPCPAASGL